MKVLKIFGILLTSLIIQSCSSKKDYHPDAHLTAREKDNVLQLIIRYMGKPPENTNERERFATEHNAYYLDLASRHRFDGYYIDGDESHYFLISRPAPSLYEKRVAIGGKLKMNAKGELIEYEEIFRTWKMNDEDLNVKGLLLFDVMVNKRDLSPYYRANSKEEYIEFPDEHNYYDKKARSWKVK